MIQLDLRAETESANLRAVADLLKRCSKMYWKLAFKIEDVILLIKCIKIKAQTNFLHGCATKCIKTSRQ